MREEKIRDGNRNTDRSRLRSRTRPVVRVLAGPAGSPGNHLLCTHGMDEDVRGHRPNKELHGDPNSGPS